MAKKKEETAIIEPVDVAYQPSNGSEGEFFTNKFCEKCEHDRVFRETQEGESSCNILMRSIGYAPGEPEYPTEWVYNERDGARCTAFTPELTPEEIEAAESDEPEFHQEGSGDLFDATGKPADEIVDDLSGASVAHVCNIELGPLFTRDLPTPVPDEILADYAREMARQHTLWVKTKIDAKAFAKACKEVTDRCEDEEIRLAEIVGTGTEEAPVAVRWSFDFSQNIKRLIRQDTMEVVEEAAMTAEDRQGDLFARTQESIENVENCLGEGARLDAEESNGVEGDTPALGDDENITEGEIMEIPGSADTPAELEEKERTQDLDNEWPEPPGAGQ